MKEDTKNKTQELLSGHVTRIVAILLFVLLCLYLTRTMAK